MNPSPLQRLARLHGVEDSYTDAFGECREVSEATLVAVLAALGEPIDTPADAVAVLDGERGQATAGEVSLPAAVVAWDGALAPLPVAPAGARGAVVAELALEDGGDPRGLVRLEVRGDTAVVVADSPLPYGVHQLAVAGRTVAVHHDGRRSSRPPDEPEEVTVIAAPSRARPVGPAATGVFAPLYGLYDRSGSIGDLGCLERLGTIAATRGITQLATLPILADWSRADDPEGSTSPYSPISRMWWHEGYLDWRRVDELAGYDMADVAVPDVAGALGNPAPFDPGRRAAALRPALEAAAAALHAGGGDRLERFRMFVAERPEVRSYARFRAAAERHGTDWRRWPATWRNGLIDDGAVEDGAVDSHVYAQFVMDEQVASVASTLGGLGAGIMLDLPVGCGAGGFDTWAYRESYATGASIGAPPDQFFTGGQNWGFVPLHPEGERRSGYEVTSGALRHLLRHAAVLRLDHVIGLSRLWWIPDGSPATEGAYVRYHLDEALALCCLEAWRHDASLVGEDLGTVEESLTESLADHGIAGMHVAVFDLESDSAHPMEPLSPRAGAAALVDTHDTATFAGWFTGHDIDDRLRLGLLDTAQAGSERKRRRVARDTLVDRLIASDLLAEDDLDDPVAVHAGLTAELGASAAGLVLLNLEDCWAELDPQNVPGTTVEHANFERPLALSLEDIEDDEGVARTVSAVTQARLVTVAPVGGENPQRR